MWPGTGDRSPVWRSVAGKSSKRSTACRHCRLARVLRRLLPDRHFKAGDRFTRPHANSSVGDFMSVLRHAYDAKTGNLEIEAPQRVVEPKAPVAIDSTLRERIERRHREQPLSEHDVLRATGRRHRRVVHDAALDHSGSGEPELEIVDLVDVDLRCHYTGHWTP